MSVAHQQGLLEACDCPAAIAVFIDARVGWIICQRMSPSARQASTAHFPNPKDAKLKLKRRLLALGERNGASSLLRPALSLARAEV